METLPREHLLQRLIEVRDMIRAMRHHMNDWEREAAAAATAQQRSVNELRESVTALRERVEFLEARLRCLERGASPTRQLEEAV